MYRVGVITLSDKGAAGERADESGPLIIRMLPQEYYKVEKYFLMPDEKEQLEETLICMADEWKLDLVFTTGGTGLSKRDITPEATMAVADKCVPGIAEAIRSFSMTVTKRAMLGRGVSVIRKNTLVINLPGSPKAVRESLSYLLDTLPHGLDILKGDAGECAR